MPICKQKLAYSKVRQFVVACRLKMCKTNVFVTFPACFLIPTIFSNFSFNCSNLLDIRNLQEQVKKAFCYQKLFWPFTSWMNCSIDLKNFANSRPLASNFKRFFQSLEHFFSQLVRAILVTKYHCYSSIGIIIFS